MQNSSGYIETAGIQNAVLAFRDVHPDDEVLTAKDVAFRLKQSERYGQKLLELGEIESFRRGRQRVTLKSFFLAYLQRLIDEERERVDSR